MTGAGRRPTAYDSENAESRGPAPVDAGPARKEHDETAVPLERLVEAAGLGNLLTDSVATDRSGALAGFVITNISADSKRIRPGGLFVAVPGTQRDGHAFVADAVERGAMVAIVERPVALEDPIPQLVVEDTRRALALLAGAFHGNPGRRVPLIGITGTVGKTSVLSMLDAILVGADRRPGSIGSLGVSVAGVPLERTEHTTPDAVRLQEELATVVDAGCDVVAMEVTSHALVQERVYGLTYELAVFTNLLPLEHEDYHGSFREYVTAKSRFFNTLAPRAPLVYNADDLSVRALARQQNVRRVGCSFQHFAPVRMHSARLRGDRTEFSLRIRRPLPRMDGGEVAPLELPLSLRVHGGSGLYNGALAAAAALCAGVPAEAVRETLAAFPPPPRRMQILEHAAFTILDDTVGHPESVSALFRVVRRMPHRRLHVAFAVRGRRGEGINRETALSLAIWSRRVPLSTLVVTRSVEATDERNRVEHAERAAFVEPLRKAGLPVVEELRLEDAVHRVLDAAADGDLVLLLGAQGMDRGASIAEAWLRNR